jgi:hypothetical protein
MTFTPRYPVVATKVFLGIYLMIRSNFFGPIMLWDFNLNVELNELKNDQFVEQPFSHVHYSHFIVD